MISFLIPAKNSKLFISDCLLPFINNYYKYNFEVIIIDDFSTDSTFNFTKMLIDKYDRLNIFRNLMPGKINALNYAFTLAKGSFVKCVDSDDVISDSIFEFLENNLNSIVIHDSFLVNDNLDIITYNKLSNKYFNSNIDLVIKNCISPARWVWSFPYEIGEEIFPIPANLPFEDFWFSIILSSQTEYKKVYIEEPLYLYRQHNNQEYGGVLNFSIKSLIFRSQRLLEYYIFLQGDRFYGNKYQKYIEKNIILYKYITNNSFSISSFFKLEIQIQIKFKFLLLIFFPKISYLVSFFKLKYKL